MKITPKAATPYALQFAIANKTELMSGQWQSYDRLNKGA
jgi:hypothetical protein